MKLYAETSSCRSGTHCAACRALEAGRGFRLSILRAYAVEGGADFPCPYGRPWGFNPPVPVPVDDYEAGGDAPCCDPPKPPA